MENAEDPKTDAFYDDLEPNSKFVNIAPGERKRLTLVKPTKAKKSYQGEEKFCLSFSVLEEDEVEYPLEGRGSKVFDTTNWGLIKQLKALIQEGREVLNVLIARQGDGRNTTYTVIDQDSIQPRAQTPLESGSGHRPVSNVTPTSEPPTAPGGGDSILR